MSKPQGITQGEFAKRDGCSQSYVSRAVSLGILPCFPDRSIDPALVGTNWRSRNRTKNAKEEAGSDPIDESGESTPNLSNDEIKGLSRTDAERYKLIYNILQQKIDFEDKIRGVVRVEEVTRINSAAFAKVRSRLIQVSAELAPNMTMIKTAGEAQQIIHRAICKALTDVSEEAAATAKRLREKRDAEG